jgi:hypothetical protein
MIACLKKSSQDQVKDKAKRKRVDSEKGGKGSGRIAKKSRETKENDPEGDGGGSGRSKRKRNVPETYYPRKVFYQPIVSFFVLNSISLTYMTVL